MEYLRKPCNLPEEGVVTGVIKYAKLRLRELMKLKSIDEHNYVEIRRLVVSLLLLKNIRRANEPGRLTYKQLEDALANNWIRDKTTNQEGHMAYVDGKNSSDSVGLLITPVLVDPIKSFHPMSAKDVR